MARFHESALNYKTPINIILLANIYLYILPFRKNQSCSCGESIIRCRSYNLFGIVVASSLYVLIPTFCKFLGFYNQTTFDYSEVKATVALILVRWTQKTVCCFGDPVSYRFKISTNWCAVFGRLSRTDSPVR